MPRAKRQVTSPEIEREIEAKGLGPEDAFQIREFATFLAMARKPGELTAKERKALVKRFGRKWLGLQADTPSEHGGHFPNAEWSQP